MLRHGCLRRHPVDGDPIEPVRPALPKDSSTEALDSTIHFSSIHSLSLGIKHFKCLAYKHSGVGLDCVGVFPVVFYDVADEDGLEAALARASATPQGTQS